MAIKKDQNQDLFGTQYNQKLSAISAKYAPKIPLVNSLISRFLTYTASNSWTGTQSQINFFDQAENSIIEMLNHLHNSPDKPLFGHVINHSFSKDYTNNITVRIGFIDYGQECLWDTFSMIVDDPVMCYCLLGTSCIDRMRYTIEQEMPVIPWKKPKLYRYHPERFASTRKYVKPVVEIYNKEVNPKTGLLQLHQVNAIAGAVASTMNQVGFQFPLKYRKDSNSSLIFDAEIALAMAYGRFVASGKQIFQFSKELTEMLNHTGTNDVKMGSIKLPYSSLYLYFGPQEDLVLENGWLVDGAYIESRGDSGNFKFTLASVPLNVDQTRLWFTHKEPFFSQDIIGEYADKNLNEVINAVYHDSINQISSTKPVKNLSEISDVTGLKIIDISEDNAIERIDAAERQFPLYQSALHLIVNALCYITSYSEDIEYKYTDDVPKILLENAKSPKQSKKIDEKLIQDGYRKVHICGEKISHQIGIVSNQRSVELHWRRGHWRRQPHGERKEQIKMIWIMPMLVGAKNNDESSELKGHIYEVED